MHTYSRLCLQLPYYIDGSAKVTQSNAILRYVARKHDLLGRTDEERVRVDVLENQAMDLRMSYVRLVYQNYVSPASAFWWSGM